MEESFCARGMSLVVVTHDRAFMESVCTSVLEMEAGEVHLHSFGGSGSYARFREVAARLLDMRSYLSIKHNPTRLHSSCNVFEDLYQGQLGNRVSS